MKRRIWKIALLLAVPLVLMALIAVVIERNSWRPRTIKTWAVEPGGLQFSPDGRTLVLDDSDLYVLDVASSTQRLVLNAASHQLFLENGNCFAATPYRENARVEIVSLRTGKSIASGPRGFLPVGSLADGSTLVGRILDYSSPKFRQSQGQLFCWKWRTDGAPKPYLRLREEPESVLWILHDKATLTDGKHFWNLATGKLRFRIEQEFNIRNQSHNPSHYIAVKKGNKLQIWNYHTGMMQSSVTLAPPVLEHGYIKVSPDCTLMAGFTGMTEAKPQLSLWNARSGQLLRQIEIPVSTYDFVFSHDGRTIAVASTGLVQLWRIK